MALTVVASAQSASVDRRAEAALLDIRPADFEAHLKFLGDDLLEGRRPGQRGYDIAANYVAALFESLGLKLAVTEAPIFKQCRCAKSRSIPLRPR